MVQFTSIKCHHNFDLENRKIPELIDETKACFTDYLLNKEFSNGERLTAESASIVLRFQTTKDCSSVTGAFSLKKSPCCSVSVRMLARAAIGKMLGQLRFATLIPASAGETRLSGESLRPRSIIRCSSHNAISSEDSSGKPYINILSAGGHTFKGDLGEQWGASGTAPEPKDYAYAALALCTSMTVRLHADKKNWPLKHVEVEVKEIDGLPGRVPDRLHAVLKLEGNLTEEQKKELLRISANCPIKMIFSGKIRNGITSEIAEADTSV